MKNKILLTVLLLCSLVSVAQQGKFAAKFVDKFDVEVGATLLSPYNSEKSEQFLTTTSLNYSFDSTWTIRWEGDVFFELDEKESHFDFQEAMGVGLSYTKHNRNNFYSTFRMKAGKSLSETDFWYSDLSMRFSKNRGSFWSVGYNYRSYDNDKKHLFYLGFGVSLFDLAR